MNITIPSVSNIAQAVSVPANDIQRIAAMTAVLGDNPRMPPPNVARGTGSVAGTNVSSNRSVRSSRSNCVRYETVSNLPVFKDSYNPDNPNQKVEDGRVLAVNQIETYFQACKQNKLSRSEGGSKARNVIFRCTTP